MPKFSPQDSSSDEETENTDNERETADSGNQTANAASALLNLAMSATEVNLAEFVLKPTAYGTFVSKTGLEFVRTEEGNYVLGSLLNPQAANAGNQSIVTVGGNIGKIEEFQGGSDWSIYNERLEQYFSANFVDEQRKVSVLLTSIGSSVYKTLRDLCSPTLPQEKTYEELCETLKKHYSPRISVYKERRQFYRLVQGSSENVSQWYARVKKGAVECQFGAELDNRIKDQFVSGLKEGKVLDRIFEENHSTPLAETLEIALKKEASLMLSSTTSAEINKVYDNKSQPAKSNTDSKKSRGKSENSKQQQQKQQQQRQVCNACGGDNHDFRKCKYRKYKCKICGKQGHLAKVCKTDSKPTNSVVEEVTESSEVCYMNVYNINSNKSNSPFDITILIDSNVKFPMEVDSGAEVSVVPFDAYKKYLSKFEIKNSNRILRYFDDTSPKVIGEIDVQITYKNKTVQHSLVITDENKRKSLFGRDLMFIFGLYVAGIDNVNEHRLDVQNVIDKYASLFDGKLGKFIGRKVSLVLKPGATPIYRKPHTVPFAFKSKVEKELETLEEQGIIFKVSNSEWGTPLVPVLKSDGNIRVCASYNLTVNKYLDDYNYPIPRIEEIFAALEGGEQFTVLDLERGYNQLEVDDKAKMLLAWSTHKGTYAVNRLPFGTKTACSIFQQAIEEVIQGIPKTKNYFDDIIITGSNRSEHLNNLETVLKRAQKFGLKFRLSKCKFLQPQVEYLGHVIDKAGLHKCPSKIEAISKAPEPKNVQEVQALIGMIKYYGKFIPNLATILSPMNDLLKKGRAFEWTASCQLAYDKVKKEIVSDRVLVHFNPELKIKLACDASKVGLGAVLLHVFPDGTEKPICFASRTLIAAEKNYSVIHKEALAIYWSVNKFFQYLKGTHFILSTDHKPLLALLGAEKGIPQMAAGRMQRWAYFLNGFNYTLEYVKGENNSAADGLSRLPLSVNSIACETKCDYFNFLIEDALPIDAKCIRTEVRKDVILSKVYEYVKNGWPSVTDKELKTYANKSHELHIEQGLVMWGYRVIIPKKFRESLLKEIHVTHMGASKMKALARQYFWWPHLDLDIENYAKICDTCNAVATNPNKSVLMKYERCSKALERVHCDFLGPLYGKTYFIIMDAYSKWPEVYYMNNITTENTLHKLRDFCARYGLPETLVSDNGRQLVSNEFENFCKMNKIKHILSAPFHPSTNGAAENAVKSFKLGLKKSLLDPQNKQVHIDTLISRYLLGYRVSPHCTTGETPAKLMLNRELRTRFDALKESVTEIKHSKQIDNYSGNRQIAFSVGDVVWIKDYKCPSKPTWVKAEVIDCLGPRNYLCRTLIERLIHKRHVDQMRKGALLITDEFKKVHNYLNEKSQEIEKNMPKVELSDQAVQDVPVIAYTPTVVESELSNENDLSNEDRTTVCKEKSGNNEVQQIELASKPDMCESMRDSKLKDNIDTATKQEIKLNVNERPKRTIKPVQRLITEC
ncbi:hypothetical protein TKK_0013377 [Trichogramma kaykai]|uniref:RNA-directed DNA polymerase n=1 Tax=Trichogramma kaykai TaxID=54128 RepID=A0ABD2WIS5_9HYME